MKDQGIKVSSNINVLGSYENLVDLVNTLNDENIIAQKRTASAKNRYAKAINEVFLQFESEALKNLFFSVISSPKLCEETKLKALALQFFKNDFLFRFLFKHCFYPIYTGGRVGINSDDVISFLNDNINSGSLNVKWSRNTIETLGSKYLTLLRKLGFLEGKSKKYFQNPHTAASYLIVFHYWLSVCSENKDIFQSPYFPFLMLSREKYIFLMKQPEIRQKLDWYFTGEKFTVEPKTTFNQYVNELSI